jgi:hypothetical protein
MGQGVLAAVEPTSGVEGTDAVADELSPTAAVAYPTTSAHAPYYSSQHCRGKGKIYGPRLREAYRAQPSMSEGGPG